ncbi:patatin-like phospholipase family protein [Kibdelosporangium aridum]|uniref:Predicted phospholipase, patatin/cPLA2 family n=1 Tax=Kibdelosporangium aridum TaxID=2030 RepID=A0A1W2FHB1_KIBAR|nr:patatin-like phospholipase family protein [Kibdelosporangium aridum]SMD21114.1 Predicted phospholipase, patatin/cPLA2 family [Kibdelosporangium aridum]
MADRIWSEGHPVREILHARRANRSLPGRREDPYKVGLAIEGGGLRGIVSAGMLVALEELGYSDAFDEVYTSSSGAMNGTYFILRDTWFPLSIYYDDLTTREFVDFGRVLRGRAPMNLDYLFDEVFVARKPLAYQKVITSPQRLHVMVTDVDAMKMVDVSDFHSPDDLKETLRASAWLPLATKGTTPFRGRCAVDGSVLQRHPFRTARSDGCTHILSLSTRPMTSVQRKNSLSNRMIAKYLDRLAPGLGSGYIEALGVYIEEDRPYLTRSRLQPEADPAVLDVAPMPGTPEVRRHESNFGVLLQGARSAYRALHVALEGKDVYVVPRLTVYR